MNKPQTLQEYLQMINLQRKKQFFMNENHNIHNPINLDTDQKIDYLMMEILEYIKHLIKQGPLYSKFQFMMEHLHKTFMRQLSELHCASVSKKYNNDKKYLDDIKKANKELTNYLEKCEQEKEETDAKLEMIMHHNKGAKKEVPSSPPPSKVKTVAIQDNFDDLDDLDFGGPAQVQKFTKNTFGKPTVTTAINFLTKNPADVATATNRPPINNLFGL